MREAEIERVKRKRPENLDAYDLVLRKASFFVNERIQSDMRLDEAGLLSVLRFNANGIRGLLGRPYDGSSLKQTYEHLNALVQEHLKSNARR